LVNIFGILIMWSLLFAALKTSDLVSGFVDRVESFAKGVASVMPVLPTPV
jgi:hypothetical protein